MDIVWADVLRGALSFFLVVVGIGIAYVCVRLGGVLGRVSVSMVRVTDEVVPILSRAQTTVDGINLELARVDEIMVSAVNATKGAEKTVTSISHAVTSPVKKASGWAGAAKEAMATFRARRAESAAPPDPVPAHDPSTGSPPEAAAPSAAAVPEPPAVTEAPPAPIEAAEPHPNGSGDAGSVERRPNFTRRGRGPSESQIEWALPKRRA